MILRPYQEAGIRSFFEYFENGGSGHPLMCFPTGTGKSLVIAEIGRRILYQWPTQRIMMLTHVKEIIEHNANALLKVWPEAPLGIYSAGLGRKDSLHPVIYGGIQSIYRNAELFGHRDIVFIDEAHLLNPSSNSMYQTALMKWYAFNPNLKVCGLTATWYRMGQGLLTQDGLFTDIIFNICDTNGFMQLISDGYLVPPIPRKTAVSLDVSNVSISNGEFVQSELQRAVDRPDVTYAALRELVETAHKTGRRSWLIFCTGIEHAEHCSETLEKYFGVRSSFVHSKISDDERDARIQAFKAGELQAICNNNILTTGFDHPPIDLIGMLRPTVSPSLWVQMLGRGTRPYSDGICTKRDCLVMDFAQNTIRLGPIDDPRIPKQKGPGNGEMPIKICDACGTYNHTRAKFCISCGTEFVFREKLTRKSDSAELITGGMPQIEKFDVTRVIYNRHVSKAGKTTVKVSYFCGMKLFNEWLSFDAMGFARHKAHEWWRQRFTGDCPPSTDDALRYIQGARVPRRVKVWVNKQWPEVLGVEF